MLQDSPSPAGRVPDQGYQTSLRFLSICWPRVDLWAYTGYQLDGAASAHRASAVLVVFLKENLKTRQRELILAFVASEKK